MIRAGPGAPGIPSSTRGFPAPIRNQPVFYEWKDR
jgi:hypothetical protein